MTERFEDSVTGDRIRVTDLGLAQAQAKRHQQTYCIAPSNALPTLEHVAGRNNKRILYFYVYIHSKSHWGLFLGEIFSLILSRSVTI